MPDRSALVDLDAISRGAEFTNDAQVEVWLDDDPELVDAVSASLRERGIAVADVRRYATIRQAYDDTVPTWSLALGAVLGPAVILIALLVLLVLAVTGWRDRARDLAILRLNGAWRRHDPMAGGVGPAAGRPARHRRRRRRGGGRRRAGDAGRPVLRHRPEAPVVDPATAWPAVLGVAAACVVLLPAAAALGGRAVARRAHLERVKENL